MGKLENITTLVDYIGAFGNDIARKVSTNHEPLYMPGTDWHPKLYRSLRAPFQGQGDAIMGAVETLKQKDAAFIVGEMGTGKTLIGALIPWTMMDAPRVLVMCPGHLTEKWVREIKLTVPEAEASVINNLSDAIAVDAEAAAAGNKPRYWVMSKERAKLTYKWMPVGKVKTRIERRLIVDADNTTICDENDRPKYELLEISEIVCPRCGKIVLKPKPASASKKKKKSEEDDVPIPLGPADIKKRKCYCQCGEALWQADNRKFRRYAIAEYLKKHLPRNFFDFFIADEVHELKGADTAQGNSFGSLAACSRKTICLTGTLLGGYASHLFYLNYRVNSTGMKLDGFEYGKTKKFVELYGVEETTVKEYESSQRTDNKCSHGTSRSSSTAEKPGISPELFMHQLMDKAIFLHLEDVSQTLPDLTEDVIGVDVDSDVMDAYNDMQDEIKAVMNPQLVKGNRQLLGTYLVNLLSYADKPFGNPSIYLDGCEYEPEEFPRERIYPKEKKLRELVQNELAQGRKCLIYATFTRTRDVTTRLQKILVDAGIKAEILRGDVKPTARESWVNEHLENGMEVMICNPELVKTGLDLLDFPTIIYTQTGYNIFTLRQSSRRSWRIGQTKEVKVFYLYYKGTMQGRAVELIGKKLDASLALEGKLTEGGLASLSDSNDGLTALAKSLNEGGVEGVETIWKKIRDKKSTHNSGHNPEPKIENSVTSGSSTENPVDYDAKLDAALAKNPYIDCLESREIRNRRAKQAPAPIDNLPALRANSNTRLYQINAVAIRPRGVVIPLPVHGTAHTVEHAKPHVVIESITTGNRQRPASDNVIYLPAAAATTAEEAPWMGEQKSSRKITAKRGVPAAGKIRKPRARKPADNAWRTNPDVNPGPEYKWGKTGWRKISQRSIDAQIRREERARAMAWKYDGATSPEPAEDWYWVNSYSYQRRLKDTMRIINVRGHWRMRRNAAMKLRMAA